MAAELAHRDSIVLAAVEVQVHRGWMVFSSSGIDLLVVEAI